MSRESDRIYNYVIEQYLDSDKPFHESSLTSIFFNNNESVSSLEKRKKGEFIDTDTTLTAMDDYLIDYSLGTMEIMLEEDQVIISSEIENKLKLSEKRNIFPQMHAKIFFQHLNQNISKTNDNLDDFERRINLNIPPKERKSNEPNQIHQSATTIPPQDISSYLLISEMIDRNSLIHSDFDSFIRSIKTKEKQINKEQLKILFNQHHAWYTPLTGVVLNINRALDHWITILSRLSIYRFDENEFYYFLWWLFNHEQFHHIVSSSWISRPEKEDIRLNHYRDSIPNYSNECGTALNCYFNTARQGIPMSFPTSINATPLVRTMEPECPICQSYNNDKPLNYQTKQGYWFLLEEALANSFAFKKNKTFERNSEEARNFGNIMREHESQYQILGYRNFNLFQNPKNLNSAYIELEKMIEGTSFNQGVNIFHDSLLRYDWYSNYCIPPHPQRQREREQIKKIKEHYKRSGKFVHFLDESWYRKDSSLNVKFNSSEFEEQCDNYGISRRISVQLKSSIYGALNMSR